ncbi:MULTISPECIES: hypothetical protein [unclassified Moraxella]|uniref:hypothetical protein n=1 Tax=unclassified Moraxella TaxID=2685852 RepID=UPI003AF7F7A0
MSDNPLPNNRMKIKVITLDELANLTKRLHKVTNFYFMGAVMCMLAGVHYASLGSELLPKIFVGLVVMTLCMTILSYRANSRLNQVLELVNKNKGKSPKR